MTPEIENLKALFDDAKAATKAAKETENDARCVLDNAVATWAARDLAARGIEISVTPVQYATYRPYDGRAPHFSNHNGPCAVVDVRGSHGLPMYRVHALTKTGALSKAKGAYDTWVYAVRPWWQA